MKRTSSKVGRDDVDILIAKELEIDARQSVRNIAAKIGKLPKTVKTRLNKMLSDEAIGFYTLINPKALGFGLQVLCVIQVAPGKVNKALKEMADFVNVQHIALTTGRYDLLVYAVFRDNDEFLNWKSNELSQVKSIATFEEMIVLRAAKYSYAYLNGETTPFRDVDSVKLDEQDLKLIKLLTQNPREPIGNMAKKLGLSRQTTAIKMNTLRNNQVLRLVSIIDPPAFGYTIQASILIKTRLDRIVPMMNELVQNPGIKHVSVITGYFNILITMIFEDLETMADFLKSELGAIPGVIHYETLITIGKPIRLVNTHLVK